MFGIYNSYFKFFGLSISYYGLIIAIGMGLGIFVACKLAKYRGLKKEDIFIVACYILPLSIIGARLYYVIFSGKAYSFLEIFEIWKGGMAIYGGVIGGVIGIALYCLIHKKNFLDVTDVAVVALILGQGIGRIGCYFAGCCYGIEVTNKALQWFPFSTKIDGVWHLSTFFYESFFDLVIFAVFTFLIIKKVKNRGIMSSLYLISYGVVRCVIETFRGDSLYIGTMKVSQLLSILIIIGGIILMLIIYGLKYDKCVEKYNREQDISEEITNNLQTETLLIESDGENKENNKNKT